MQSISDYFSPVEIEKGNHEYPESSLGKTIRIHSAEAGFPSLDKIQLALIGVNEDRMSVNNAGCADAPDAVRSYLYRLVEGSYKVNMADLGNIKAGFSVEDTYFAVSSVVQELVKKNIIPIIIGGGQDITYANYIAYEKLEQIVNIVAVDARLDLGDADGELNSQTYLGKIILHQPNYLFNFSNIGYQSYFVEPKALDLMAKLFFDSYRLGQVRANMEEVEPVVRNADIVSFDISAIRQPDAPGNNNSSPNGFYGEEACQIARYAGLSDKLSSVGFYELNPSLDNRQQTAHLTAQMIWYFIDGFYNRKKDFPVGDKTDYTRYRVILQQHKHELVFYKSNKSERWWMEVPYPPNKKIRYERHHLVPCSYSDYQTACNEDMPDRWWQTFQKLS